MIISFKGNGGGGGGYVLPTATANRLGGIKVGSGLTVQDDGTLSAEGGGSVPVATTGSTGVVKVGSGLDVDSAGTLSSKIVPIDLRNKTQQELSDLHDYMKSHSADTSFEVTIESPGDGDPGSLITTSYTFGGDEENDIYLTFFGRQPHFYLFCLSIGGQLSQIMSESLITKPYESQFGPFQKNLHLSSAGTLYFEDTQVDSGGTYDDILTTLGSLILVGAYSMLKDVTSPYDMLICPLYVDSSSTDSGRTLAFPEIIDEGTDGSIVHDGEVADHKITLVYDEYKVSYYCGGSHSWIVGLSVTPNGGGSGGGDYIVTEALSSITNPTEGMIAYVPAHYEDRGATHIKFELNDTSENVEMWYPDLIYFDNFYSWDRVSFYSFNATDNENSHISFRKEDSFRKPDLYSSDAWFSLSTGSRVLVKVSGATIEFLVDSGLTITGTQNPDDKFTVTTSTGLTPVRGMTYVYHSGWILKEVDFAYDRLQDYMQSCVYLSKNPIGEQELAFGLWGINFDTKYWFGMNAEGQPLGWCGYNFSCVSTEDENQKKYEFFVEGNLSEGVASWNPNARVTDMKLLDFIRIPVLVEDAVLTEDIEYEGQIVAHSGDTVASAGTIVAETDLYNVAAYGYDRYGKNRVIFAFVQSGDCSWNSEQQKVIVNEGPGLDAYGDLQNIHRVAVEGEPEDYYISATMDYNGTLYRGSWKQHDRYTRWITLSWTQIQ